MVPIPGIKPAQLENKMKMKIALVLGPDEDTKGQVVVKNLTNGEQTTVTREALLNTICELLK